MMFQTNINPWYKKLFIDNIKLKYRRRMSLCDCIGKLIATSMLIFTMILAIQLLLMVNNISLHNCKVVHQDEKQFILTIDGVESLIYYVKKVGGEAGAKPKTIEEMLKQESIEIEHEFWCAYSFKDEKVIKKFETVDIIIIGIIACMMFVLLILLPIPAIEIFKEIWVKWKERTKITELVKQINEIEKARNQDTETLYSTL